MFKYKMNHGAATAFYVVLASTFVVYFPNAWGACNQASNLSTIRVTQGSDCEMTVGPINDPTNVTTASWYYIGVSDAKLTLTNDANITYAPYGARFYAIHATDGVDSLFGSTLNAKNMYIDLKAPRENTEKYGLHIDNGATFNADTLRIDIDVKNTGWLNTINSYGIVAGSGQYNQINPNWDDSAPFSYVNLKNLEININTDSASIIPGASAGIRSGQYWDSTANRAGAAGYVVVTGDTVIKTSGTYSPGVYISGGDSQVHFNNSKIVTAGSLSNAVKIGKNRDILTGSGKFFSYGFMDFDTTGSSNVATIQLLGDGSLFDANANTSSGVIRSAGNAIHFANREAGASSQSTSDGITARFNNTAFNTNRASSLFLVDAGQTNVELSLRGVNTLATAHANGWLMEVQNASAWGNNPASATLNVSEGARVVGLTTRGTTSSDLFVNLEQGAVWQLAQRGSTSTAKFNTLNIESAAQLYAGGDGSAPTAFILEGDVSNRSGEITLGNALTGDTLEIKGNYAGSAGMLSFDTVLEDDSSATDLLKISGDTSGDTQVKVNNLGGAGAQTIEGIKVIDVMGASAGRFTLVGDYVHNGEQAMVAGAYAYKLQQGGVSTPTDGDWYLRSILKPLDPSTPVDVLKPLYQAGVPTYESYPQALLTLNSIGTLQQRVGNRFWAGAGNQGAAITQGNSLADAGKYVAKNGLWVGSDNSIVNSMGSVGSTEETAVSADTHTEKQGVWLRVEGAHSKIEPRSSMSETNYDQNQFKLQVGVDQPIYEDDNGVLIGGVFAQYLHGKTKVHSDHGDGEISTNGYGVGATLTWYGERGLYVDSQAHATWYSSDLSSRLAGRDLVSNNDGFGYALSVEGGQRFAIDEAWSWTPQAQLVYSHVDFDHFTDPFGAKVSLQRKKSLLGRLGVALDREHSWVNEKGQANRTHLYAITNLYHEFMNGTEVDVSATRFASKQDRLWGGVGLGASYNWNDDNYSVFFEGVGKTSLNNFGDSYTLQGNLGFRVKW